MEKGQSAIEGSLDRRSAGGLHVSRPNSFGSMAVLRAALQERQASFDGGSGPNGDGTIG